MHCDNDPALFDFESNSTRQTIISLAKFQRYTKNSANWQEE